MSKKSRSQEEQAGQETGMQPSETQAALPVESKAERFRRLANRRVPAAVKHIGYVANLGNHANYEYTPEQRDKILRALRDAVDTVERAFAGNAQPKIDWTV